jgi:hypothetical protein
VSSQLLTKRRHRPLNDRGAGEQLYEPMNETPPSEEQNYLSLTSAEIEPKRLEDFARRLAALSERRIPAKMLWAIFGEAFPHRPRGTEPRQWMLGALRYAEARGVIRIPPENGRRWDRGLEPLLPTSVNRVEPLKPGRNESWRFFPWHPLLYWVADLLKLTQGQECFLRRVHNGLVNREFAELAPLKYRSLQLTGDEKRLGVLAKGALFGPGRLSLELLGCLPDIPPLTWERVNEQPIIIVFENGAPFTVARNVLIRMHHSPYGMIAWGQGASFIQSVRHLVNIGRPISRIEYVGDIDRSGLRIAQTASEAAIRVGLPQVEPAKGLHHAMLKSVSKFGYQTGLKCHFDERAENDEALVTWLPQEIHAMVLKILSSNSRIPEEVLGPDELHEIWFDDK